MGLFDAVKGTVVVQYKVETEHAKTKVRELAGEQKKQAQEGVAAMERQTRAAELMAAKMTAGIGLIVGGYALAKKGVEAYEKSLIQAGDSGNASLQRLKNATNQADRAVNEIQISIGKMVVAAAPVVQMFADMASQLGNIAAGIGDVVAAASNIPGGGLIGKGLGLAARYGGPVNQGLAAGSWAVSGLRDLANIAGNGPPGSGPWSTARTEDIFLRAITMAGDYSNEYARSLPGSIYAAAPGSNRDAYIDSLVAARGIRESEGRMHLNNLLARGQGFLGGALRGVGIGTTPRRGGSGSTIEAPGMLAQLQWALAQQQRNDQFLLHSAGDTVRGEGFGAWSDFEEDAGGRNSGLESMKESLRVLMKEDMGGQLAKIKADRRDSMLTQIFGTPAEINAQAEALALAGKAVDGLSGAAEAAMNAWITGEQSAGKAALLAIGNTVGGMAGEMAARSTRELIEAGARLLLGDVTGAGRHAAAGALYGTGALALGAAAREIHPSAQVKGKGGGRSSSAGLGAGGGGGGGGGEGRTLNIHLGDSLGWESPSTQAIKFRQLERHARNRLPPPAGVGD